MAYTHPETGDTIKADHYQELVAKAEDLLATAEEGDCPEHVIDLLKGILGEFQEYTGETPQEDSSQEGVSEKESPDYSSMPLDAMRKDLHKKGIIKITVGHQ